MGLFRYNSSMIQIVIAALIYFGCSGFFDILTSIGGIGQASIGAYEDASIAMTVTFSIFSFFGASIYNIYGRFVLIPAALSYALFIGSYLSSNERFYIAASALSGAGSGLLWAVLTGIVISYPNEKDKGKAFSLFWFITQLGNIIGIIIVLATRWSAGSFRSLVFKYYIVFIVLITFSSLITFLLLPPNKVKRSNGSTVSLHKSSNWKRELIELLCLFKNRRLLVLIPLFFGSNWFQTYQLIAFNNFSFMTIRARALNGFLYILFQIIGGVCIGFLLDAKILGLRKRRGVVITTSTLVFTVGLCIGCVFVQKDMINDLNNEVLVDIYDESYPGRAVVYSLFGILDSILQGLIYWLLGTMTNDTERAVRYGAFYKAFQIAAGAISNQLPAYDVAPMTQLGIAFAIIIVGLLLSYAVSIKITEVTTEQVDNLINSDQKVTIVGGNVQETEYTEETSSDKNQV